MPIENFIKELEIKLQSKLPGFEAQSLMAPKLRYNLSESEIEQTHARASAVLIPLYKKDHKWFTVFIQRHDYKGVHSGQISFPGGKKDEGDIDLTETALREAEEEVNINRHKVKVLGQLSQLYIPPSNFLVTPIIGYLEEIPVLKKQPYEVKEILEIPLDLLFDPSSIKNKIIYLANGNHSETPYYDAYGKVIWGATAMILSEFIKIANG